MDVIITLQYHKREAIAVVIAKVKSKLNDNYYSFTLLKIVLELYNSTPTASLWVNL